MNATRTVRVLLAACGLLLTEVPVVAQSTFVMPSGSAEGEGSVSSVPILPGRVADYIPYRHQQVYGAGDMAMPFGVYYITAVSFRLLTIGGGGTSLDTVVPDIEFRMSTTSRRVDSLHPFFAENVGPDETVVYPRGSMRVIGTRIPGQALQPFSVHIAFTTPFLYDKSWGNLLLDIINYAGSPIAAGLDSHYGLGDSVSSLGNNRLTEGVDLTSGLATQFEYRPVPEPKIAWLLGFGGLSLLFLRTPGVQKGRLRVTP